MAPRNLLLLIFWLLAASLCVTYVAVTTVPVPTGVAVSSQVDLQRLRDRPLRCCDPYLPRLIPRGKVPEIAIAKAPPLGPEQPTSKSFAKPKQRTLEVPRAEQKVSYSLERNPADQVEAQESTKSALLGAKQLKPTLQRSAPRAGKSKPIAKLSGTKKKVIAERAPRNSRFARRQGGRRLGLFALSGDFVRPSRY